MSHYPYILEFSSDGVRCDRHLPAITDISALTGDYPCGGRGRGPAQVCEWRAELEKVRSDATFMHRAMLLLQVTSRCTTNSQAGYYWLPK